MSAQAKLTKLELEEATTKIQDFDKFLEILTYFLIKIENILDPEEYKPLKRTISLEEIKEKLIRIENSILSNLKSPPKNERLLGLEDENRNLRRQISELVERQHQVMAITQSSGQGQSGTSFLKKDKNYDEIAERLAKVEMELKQKPKKTSSGKTRSAKQKTKGNK